MAIIPSESFGTSSGFADYDKDQLTQATTQHTQAMTRLGNAEAQRTEQANLDEQRMMQIMSGQGAPALAGQEGPTTTSSLLDRVEGISKKLFDSGFYKAGSDMATKASQMRAHDAQIRREQMDERFKTMDHQEKALGTLNGILVGIDGPESFVAAKDAWRQEHPDDPIPPQFDHYDPAVIDALKHGTKEGLARLKDDRETLRQQDLEEARVARIKEQKFRDQLLERRVQAEESREARLAKNGGAKIKAATAPGTLMVQTANSVISEEFPDLKGTQAAIAIASDAKVRMQNEGLNMSEAINQAFAKAKENGDFESVAPSRVANIPFTEHGGGTTYVGGGKSAEMPLSMPKAVGGKPPPASAFKAGRWYQTPKGVAKWTGKNFTTSGGGVKTPASVPSGRAGASSPDEEDEGVE